MPQKKKLIHVQDNQDELGNMTDLEDNIESMEPTKVTKIKKRKTRTARNKKAKRRKMTQTHSKIPKEYSSSVLDYANTMQPIMDFEITRRLKNLNINNSISNNDNETRRGLSYLTKMKKQQLLKDKKIKLSKKNQKLPSKIETNSMRSVNSPIDLRQLVLKPKTKRRLRIPKTLANRIKLLNRSKIPDSNITNNSYNTMIMGKCPKCKNYHMMPKRISNLTNEDGYLTDNENNDTYVNNTQQSYNYQPKSNYTHKTGTMFVKQSINGKTHTHGKMVDDNSRKNYIRTVEYINGKTSEKIIPRN